MALKRREVKTKERGLIHRRSAKKAFKKGTRKLVGRRGAGNILFFGERQFGAGTRAKRRESRAGFERSLKQKKRR